MITFTKAVASGNDFIILENKKRKKAGWSALAKKLCDRKAGIGADGLLILGRSEKADLKMRIFNPDESEANMCGNGSRCAALYYRNQKPVTGNRITIETKAGIITAEFPSGNRVKVKLTDPSSVKLDVAIRVGGKNIRVHHVNTGVPHVIYFTEQLDGADVKGTGRLIRYHSAFRPAGANADFVKILGRHAVGIRTYERGVEDETLACGTGASASAVIAFLKKGTLPPVYVHTRSGETLKVYFDKNLKNLYLEGGASIVYEGKIRGK